MLTISQPFGGYTLKDLRSREVVLLQNTTMYDDLAQTETSAESLLNSPNFHHLKKRKQFSQHEEDQDGCSKESAPTTTVDEPVKKAMKINHNASERDRRKKINGLYDSLRALLPPAYQEKKLSIPQTVSRVLKYIPELLKELEALAKKKESQENSASHKRRKIFTTTSSSLCLLASVFQINDREMMIQITTMKFSSCLYAKVLSKLEQESLVLLNSSCFESSQGRAFYNLHLEVTGAQVIDLEGLKRQIVYLCENEEGPLLTNFRSIGQLEEIF